MFLPWTQRRERTKVKVDFFLVDINNFDIVLGNTRNSVYIHRATTIYGCSNLGVSCLQTVSVVDDGLLKPQTQRGVKFWILDENVFPNHVFPSSSKEDPVFQQEPGVPGGHHRSERGRKVWWVWLWAWLCCYYKNNNNNKPFILGMGWKGEMERGDWFVA